MNKLIACISASVGCALVIAWPIAFTYHTYVVTGLEKSLAEARTETQAAQDAYDLFRYRLIGETAQTIQRHLQSTGTAMTAREETREAIQEAGTRAQRAIVEADTSQATEAGRALDLDVAYPARIADELRGLHDKAVDAGARVRPGRRGERLHGCDENGIPRDPNHPWNTA